VRAHGAEAFERARFADVSRPWIRPSERFGPPAIGGHTKEGPAPQRLREGLAHLWRPRAALLVERLGREIHSLKTGNLDGLLDEFDKLIGTGFEDKIAARPETAFPRRPENYMPLGRRTRMRRGPDAYGSPGTPGGKAGWYRGSTEGSGALKDPEKRKRRLPAVSEREKLKKRRRRAVKVSADAKSMGRRRCPHSRGAGGRKRRRAWRREKHLLLLKSTQKKGDSAHADLRGQPRGQHRLVAQPGQGQSSERMLRHKGIGARRVLTGTWTQEETRRRLAGIPQRRLPGPGGRPTRFLAFPTDGHAGGGSIVNYDLPTLTMPTCTATGRRRAGSRRTACASFAGPDEYWPNAEPGNGISRHLPVPSGT